MIRRASFFALAGIAASAALPASGAALSVPKALRAGQPAVAAPDAKVKLRKLSTDPFTNSTSQHKTEVEPDVVSYGSTLVSAFQEGRFTDGGGSDVGWATSTNGGATWTHGSLPGITTIEGPSGTYARDTDAAVAYDSAHGLWLIASLPIIDLPSQPIGQMPLINSSADGLHWSNPVEVAPNDGDFIDKSWITCDNWAKSPYLGHCYVEFDDAFAGDYEMMSTSTNGGQSWSSPYAPGQYGLGGQPLALPNGTVVVPYEDDSGNIWSFTSSNGGKTWGNAVEVGSVNEHGVAGNVRTSPLPSAQIDGGGTIYTVWQDCSFRTNCSSNDIVMSTSTDGTHWTSKARIPIDPVTSTVDHFVPGIGVDVTTSGSSAHLGLTYYFFPKASCTVSTCQLYAGFVSSSDGGQTWSAPTTLTKAMNVTWLASTDQGYMAGDYIATAFSGGLAYGTFATAKALKGGKYDEYMTTMATGFAPSAARGRYTSRGERPVPGAHSDRPPHVYPPPISSAFTSEE